MKYFIGFLISIALIAAVFILVLRGFTSHSSNTKTQFKLADYATGDLTLQITTDGPINAPSKHQGYRITVDRNNARIDILQGYDDNVAISKTYPNTQASFDEFLHALDLANFTSGNSDPKMADEKGYCAAGDRFVYEAIGQGGIPSSRFWSTSCRQGNFKGQATNVRQLFQRQIPEYDQLTAKMSIQ